MDYRKIYNNIIENRRNKPYGGYVEIHHIIPRCLGGDNSKNNLIKLSAREHFVCHLLLTKFYPEHSVEWKKMIKAFYMMLIVRSDNQERYISSRDFSALKEQLSIIKSLEQYGSGNSQYGKPKSAEQRKRISETLKKRSPLRSEKVSVREELKKKNIELYSKYYKIYNVSGFDKFVKITGYAKSKQNLVMMFSRHVKEFVPQNGKPRGG